MAEQHGPYSVLMIDPPWPVDGHWGRRRGGGPVEHLHGVTYSTVAWESLWGLLDSQVLNQAASHHALFLWTLEQYLTETDSELVTRGYRRSARIVWDKGNGPLTYRLRRSHEYLLWYCRPRLLPASMAANCRYTSIIRAPSREHSRKPEAAYRLVEALYPDVRRLDAFTREYRPGWDGWGLERDKFTPLLAPLREAQDG